MLRSIRFTLCFAVLSLFAAGQARAADKAPSTDAPKLLSVERIWDAGKHNAFTDLIRFRDAWYCTFREADEHVGGDGMIRVLRSADGREWRSVAGVTEKGIDLRDPKFSITPDGRLMIVAGGSLYRGTKTLQGRQPRVLFSADGAKWSAPERVLDEGHWLWRVTWHKGRAYGMSYVGKPRDSTEEWPLRWVTSDDGVKWRELAKVDAPGRPNECTVRFRDDDTAVALLRREGGNQHGWIGTSAPPYDKWNWTEIDARLGGPNFIILPDGAMWAGSRSHTPEGPRTVLARMTTTSYEPVLTLPSSGDNSYPGLVWHDKQLWMSYYSSHDGKTSIYLAKIALP
ncbi:MAG: exo-alpha-sialidase [Planctomycetes bacterium]|nr:exo-alpha-sialidase [Planctomycetota bacterium]